MADNLREMNIEGSLLHAAWDRKVVREFCLKVFCPSILECLGNNEKMKEYRRGKRMADEFFRKVIADPVLTKRVIKAYSEYLNRGE